MPASAPSLRFLLFLALAEANCSRCIPIDSQVPKTANVTKMLAGRVWYQSWECNKHDWNTVGYSDAMKGQPCDASAPEVTRFVTQPNIIAALKGPKGDIGVVSVDWKVGYAPSADAGITWLWQMKGCAYGGETRGLRCFEEL